MKRLISMALIVCMIVSSFSFVSTAVAPFVQGDANGDGVTNAQDAFAIKLYSARVDTAIADSEAADVTCDGKVNAKDLLALKRHIVGVESLESAFPMEYEDGTVGRIRIGENNIRDYTIVVTNTANANMVFAAEELQKFVRLATNIELPIADVKPDSDKIIILREETDGALGNDGFSITVEDGKLTVLGGALRGTMYGVYELLEDYFGYRFYEKGRYTLEEVATVTVPEGTTDVQIPDSLYRNINLDIYDNSHAYTSVIKRKLSGATKASSILDAKYGYGIARTFLNAHSLDYFAQDYYREWGRYCLTDWYNDPEDDYYDIFEECIDRMSALLDSKIADGGVIGKDITEISCSYAAVLSVDNYCKCPFCRKIYNEEGTHSGVLIDFVNAINAEIQQRYPGITVITNAYAASRVPPKTRSLDDGIILLYCWNGCVNHKIEDDCCNGGIDFCGAHVGDNSVEQDYYLQWIEHCSATYIWYYPINIYYTLAPLTNMFNIYHDMQWFMEHKAIGFYVKGDTADYAFDGMKCYLIAEMMWDKDITEEEYLDLMKKYLQDYFGAGWEYILEYLYMLEESGDSMGCYMTEYSHPMEMYDREYWIKNFDKMFGLMESAYEAAETEEQKSRVEMAAVHTAFLGYNSTYYTNYVNGTAEQRAAYEEGYRALYEFINDNGLRVAYDKVGISKAFSLEVSPCELIYGFDD